MRIDGLLVLDKPEGMTSLSAVRVVKHCLEARKAGHIGTLDPFATGVLPVVINEGTKLVPFLEEGPKTYEGLLKLGEETTTDDPTGDRVSVGPWQEVSPERIHEVFRSFLGRSSQIPPMFSAVKIGGVCLYRYARRGIEIDRKEREIEIYDLKVCRTDLPYLDFRVSCSKGTYIRTLARDIGRKLGCGAHLLRLRRVRSGPFTIEQAVSWEKVKASRAEDLSSFLISPIAALPALPEMVGDETLVKKARLGMGMIARDLRPRKLPFFERGEWIKFTHPVEGLIAILKSEVRGDDISQIDPERVALRPVKVFSASIRSEKAKEDFHGTGSGEGKRDY